MKNFSFISIVRVLHYYWLKKTKRLDYKKKFKVKFRHNGKTFLFILRQNNDDFAILREVFMSKVYDVCKNRANIIFDCGSHIGCAAIYYAKKHPDVEVFCFEPDDDSRDICIKNAKLNNVFLHVFKFGISEKSGTLPFDKNLKNPSFSHIKEKGNKRILVRSLDQIIDFLDIIKIDILKLDIEGHEIQAFKGLKKNADKIKCVVLENHKNYYSLEEIKKAIKSRGYKIQEEPRIWKKIYSKKNAMFLLKRK